MFKSRLVKSLLIAITSLMLPLFTFAQDGTAAKPVISVPEAFYSFGTVSQGTVIKHDFIVKNIGNVDLVVQRVIPGCGCTAALPPTGPIPPGQSAPVAVTFDSAGFEGSIEKSVRIFSNDTDTQTPVLTLKGSIETPLTIDPVRINFGDISKGSPVPPREFSISLKAGAQGLIKSISSFSQDLAVTSKKVDARTTSGEVALLDSAKTGDFRDRLVVTYEAAPGGAQQLFNIPVVAMIRGSVELLPKTLSVGVVEGSKAILRSARLVNRSKAPLEVFSIISDTPAISAEAVTVKAGKEFNIVVTVDPAKVNADIRASLRIETNNKEQGTVILNVYGILPPKR